MSLIAATSFFRASESIADVRFKIRDTSLILSSSQTTLAVLNIRNGFFKATLSSPRLRLSLCWWGEEWQDEGLVKRASAADFVNVGGLLTEGEVSRDGRGRTVEEAVPEGAARSAEADSTVRPRPKFFPPSSDLGLTRPSPFPRGTRRASCSRAFRAACGCCISRSRASPPQSPRPSCGSSSRGNIRP